MDFVFRNYINKIKNSFGNLSLPFKDQGTDWPENWSTVEYKDYPRFKKIKLETDEKTVNEFKIADSLEMRNSLGERMTDEIDFKKLSNILYYSLGEKPNSKHRFYPSAGTRYPLEAYIFVNTSISGLEEGIYHYNISENALEFMWKNEFAGSAFSYVMEKNEAKVFIVLTSMIERSSRKYGEVAYKFSLIETGTVLQNLSLLCTSYRISSSVVNQDDFLFEKALDINTDIEFVTGFMSLAFPKIEYEKKL